MKDTPFRGHSADEIDLKRAARLADVRTHAPRHVEVFKRAYGGKSLRAGVNAHCVECMGFDASEVAACTAYACPLFAYRPGVRKED